MRVEDATVEIRQRGWNNVLPTPWKHKGETYLASSKPMGEEYSVAIWKIDGENLQQVEWCFSLELKKVRGGFQLQDAEHTFIWKP